MIIKKDTINEKAQHKDHFLVCSDYVLEDTNIGVIEILSTSAQRRLGGASSVGNNLINQEKLVEFGFALWTKKLGFKKDLV